MKPYRYVAIGSDGRRHRGTAYAPEPSSLRDRLIEARLHPLVIRRALFTHGALVLSEAEAARLARDIAQLMTSGMALAPALSLLESRETAKVAAVVREVRQRLIAGEPLSIALGAARGGPARLLQALARGGEASGRQAEVLAAGAASLDRTDQLKTRLTTLSIYPAAVIAVALGSIAVYAYAVLPALEPAFESMGGDIPDQTRAVLAFGAVVRALLPSLAVLAAGATGVLTLWRSARSVAFDLTARLLLRGRSSPFRDFVFAALASRLAVMLEAGVPLAAAWRVGRGPGSAPPLASTLAAQDQRLMEGARLSDVLARIDATPRDLVHYVALGEQSGRTPKALNDAAASMGARAQQAIERTLSIFTPLVIILVGAMVGLITMMVFQGLLAVGDAVSS